MELALLAPIETKDATPEDLMELLKKTREAIAEELAK